MADKDEIPRIIERGWPNAVTYDLSSDSHVRITLPPNSTWTSGLHWHESHTEFLQVVCGSIKVRLGDTVQTISATAESQPELRVDRFVWHEWQAAPGSDEVVVVERTDPSDGDKHIFFWNLNGVILNAPKLLQGPLARCPQVLRGLALDFWITLHLFVVFHNLDNFPVLLNIPDLARRAGFYESSAMSERVSKAMDWAVSHFVLYLAILLGKALGVTPVRREYTPRDAFATWRARNQSTKAKEL